jgi:hypothetical protein
MSFRLQHRGEDFADVRMILYEQNMDVVKRCFHVEAPRGDFIVWRKGRTTFRPALIERFPISPAYI